MRNQDIMSFRKALALIYHVISRLPNYIRRFGLFNGIRAILNVEVMASRKSLDARKVHLPSLPWPIHLRPTVSDRSVFWQCIVQGQYDLEYFMQTKRLNDEYSEMVRRGERPLIIDCGGNIGLASVWFAMKYPEALIFSVEPDEANFSILKLNTAGFGSRVQALKGGIWGKSGHLKISNPNSGSSAFRVALTSEDTPGSLRAYTIEEICALAGAARPFIVKIDIEGAQKELFMSDTDWVLKTSLIILELDDWVLPWQGTSRPFFSSISRYPFEYLLNGESIFCFRDAGG